MTGVRFFSAVAVCLFSSVAIAQTVIRTLEAQCYDLQRYQSCMANGDGKNRTGYPTPESYCYGWAGAGSANCPAPKEVPKGVNVDRYNSCMSSGMGNNRTGQSPWQFCSQWAGPITGADRPANPTGTFGRPMEGYCPPGGYHLVDSRGAMVPDPRIMSMSHSPVAACRKMDSAPVSCPAGYRVDGDACSQTLTAAASCPAGYSLSNNACIKKEVAHGSCPAGHTSQQGLCVQSSDAPVICPGKTKFLNGSCWIVP